jgi:coenzyme F420-reducing hydrogenase gamma subunit
MKKLKVGLFSFTCDEGCSIVFLEILNKKFFEWKDVLEFKHCRILQSKSEIKDLDVAFIEGAISTYREVEKLNEIRNNTKKLVAIGSCAIAGAPSNIRNFLDKEKTEEIKPILEKFGHREKVSSVSELVTVDESVPGCPMEETKFVEIMEKYIKEFGV